MFSHLIYCAVESAQWDYIHFFKYYFISDLDAVEPIYNR
jgi:hypothetical protein